MDIKQKVGNRIRELRKNIKLSQEALALKAEVDRTYVTDVEMVAEMCLLKSLKD
jgi:DNA-binding XRE family transcriptional regulator